MLCFAIVLLLLEGSNNLMALGLTRVELSMKKMSSRNTRSDMDAMLNSVLILFLDLIAILVDYEVVPGT
jgi:hypothetical protein